MDYAYYKRFALSRSFIGKTNIFTFASMHTSAEPDFYPTVKAALHHKSIDSEEDCKGLGCH